MVQMLKALIVPGVLAVAGCCWWWYSSRKKTPGTSQDSEEKEDELSSSNGEEQCVQSGTRAPPSSPEELPLLDCVDDIKLAESSEEEMQLEEPIIIEDPQTKDTTVSAIELPELTVVDDLSSSSEDEQCAQSSPEELPLQDSVEDSQPDGQCAQSSPEELPLQDCAGDSRPAESSEGKSQLEEPSTTIEDPQAEDTPVSAVELPDLSSVDDLSSCSEDRQCPQSETVSSPEELPLQDSVDDSQPAKSSAGKRQLEEPIISKDIPASFLGRWTKPRVLSTSVPVKPFFIRDEKYEDTMESFSQVAWDSVMDDWY
ncbi:retinitis pigmentosa 1-like 1 protein [Astyanax mexicanus]|uniref:retinitis pigmentosa 1-like 1 protein n=1 Tax=Astyanax mexicanus TaxID=7994 RepID=UPI0020CADB0A|nr:retinitis pigmentosa 1-like 1 protein [Astyanax mexicanus]